MRRPFAVLALALAACGVPALGPAPFACPDLGPCPDGYRCAEGVCISTDAPAPPFFVSETASDTTEPLLVYDGKGYGIFTERVDDTTRFHVLHLTRYAGGARTGDDIVATLTKVDGSRVGLDAVYLPTSDTYVVAWTVDNKLASALTVRAVAGATGRGMDLPLSVSMPPTPLGFSTPSLSTADGTSAYLAYTFADPTTAITDTLHCATLTPGSAASESCVPAAAMSRFVSDAIVDAIDDGATLFWRDTQYRASLTKGQTTFPPVTLADEIIAVRHTAKLGGFVALVVQLNVMDVRVRWRLALATIDEATGTGTIAYVKKTFDSIPDVITVGDHLLFCAYDGKDLTLQRYAVPGALSDRSKLEQPIGTAIPIARLSTAPVRSCRLAVGTDDVGIVWQEAAPNDQARTYFTTLPRAGL